jgi:hypothetical protein
VRTLLLLRLSGLIIGEKITLFYMLLSGLERGLLVNFNFVRKPAFGV